jgi:hypothetical protein
VFYIPENIGERLEEKEQVVGNQASQKLLGKLQRLYNKLHRGGSSCVSISAKRTKVVLAAVALVLLSGTISGLMVAQVLSQIQSISTISSVGTVKAVGVGVYWNSGATNRTTAINWGTLDPGSQKSFTVYIRNEGNSAMTLSLSASNWNPSTASNSMSLSWNYNGQSVNAGGTVQVTLTLAVSGSITGVSNFSFDVVIIGSS